MTLQDHLELPPMGTDALGSEKIPIDSYASPEFFELEKRNVFGKNWLLVGREGDVAKPGDFITYEIDAMSVSVVVVRAKDGALHAFHNVCTHRGARLAEDPCGRARGGLVCPLHGWAYGFDGKVLDVPGGDRFDDLNVEEQGLHQVSVDVWGGFVFINLDPQPARSVHDHFSELGGAFDRHLGQAGWTWNHGWRTTVKANWKLAMNAQLEGYHVDQNHKNTIAGLIPSERCRPYAFSDSAGVPGGVGVYLADVLNPTLFSPVDLLAGKYRPSGGALDEDPEGVLKGDNPFWLFDNYILFPNVILFVQKGRFVIQRTTPVSVGECIWEHDVYDIVEPTNFGQLFNAEQARVQGRDAMTEDLFTAESVQKSYQSGAISHVVYGRQEVALRALARTVLRSAHEDDRQEARDA